VDNTIIFNNKSQYVAEISHVSKIYGTTRVVDDVSFTLNPGEIFGLIGPNGAGKTTIIRMLMDIIKADSGIIKIMNELMNERTKDKIGYLPEERGLYRKLTVSQCLIYLANLKNTSSDIAEKKANELLTQTGMMPHRNKKIEALSKGMGQLIQFIATILHDPQLVVLDEPFTGLDPVNVSRIKEMIFTLKQQGKTIILSTHMMNEVEELCDRILMINKGRAVLYGELREIKSKYPVNSVLVATDNTIPELNGVREIKQNGHYQELLLKDNITSQMVLRELLDKHIVLTRFEIGIPSLREIFIRVIEENK
jgi:ABC-2 type transport system ATP-binding protein